MKKHSLAIVTLAFLFTACSTTGFRSGTGGGGIVTNHYESELVTANQAGRKRGQACTENILGAVTSGDASISAAMKDGAITTVSSVDRKYKNILFVYGQMCTIVTGN